MEEIWGISCFPFSLKISRLGVRNSLAIGCCADIGHNNACVKFRAEISISLGEIRENAVRGISKRIVVRAA